MSTVIIFIVTVLLLSQAGVALWLLWKCIWDCNMGSDDERDLRKTRRYEQKFSNLVDKQDRELQRIAELEERFELQAECLQMDKARILQMLQGQQPLAPSRHPDEAVSRLRRASVDSDSDDSNAGDRMPLMQMPPSDRSLSSMNWGLSEHLEGPRLSMLTPPYSTSRQPSKSRESTFASEWSTTGATPKYGVGNGTPTPLLRTCVAGICR